MVHTLGGLGHPEITRGSLIPTLWVSHRSFGDMGGGTTLVDLVATWWGQIYHLVARGVGRVARGTALYYFDGAQQPGAPEQA